MLRTLRNDFARYAKDDDIEVEGIQVINDSLKEIEDKPYDAPLKESQVYNNLGLKELDTTNRLKLFQFDCKHDEFKLPKCFRNQNLIETIVEYL